MSTADDLAQVAILESLGLVKMFESIVDSAHLGKKVKREKIQPLIDMRLVEYEQGRARPTHRGYSVSTRIIVKRAQQNPAKPGYWRS
jgi:hypothetical protein